MPGSPDAPSNAAAPETPSTGTGPPQPLPLFPLEQVLLFPKVQLPLYLFEPRYRALARAALDGDKRIGMVAVLPQHRDAMRGDPPVFDVGCEGLVTRARENPDGTFHILLEGLQRFRILEEIERPEGTLFRSARVERLGDDFPDCDGELVSRLRGEIVDNLGILMKRTQPDRQGSLSAENLASVEDETLVNALAQSLEFGVSEKQGLLQLDSVRERYEGLAGLLKFRLAELHGQATPASGRVH